MVYKKLDKYQSKLDKIKSRRINLYSRLKHITFFLGLLILAYIVLIIGYKGLFELLIQIKFNNQWLRYLSFILIIFSAVGLLFIIFKIIGSALNNLTIGISGINIHKIEMDQRPKVNNFYWLLYSVFYLMILIVIVFEFKYNHKYLLLPLFLSTVLIGLFGLSYKIRIYKQLFWKLIFYIQIMLLILGVFLYFYLHLSIPLTSNPFARVLFTILFIAYFFIVPVYGLWVYIYRIPKLWSKQ